jgi:lipid-A-disaccharide synthase
MNPWRLMLIAGETSGDWLAAELVRALSREFSAGAPSFSRDFLPLQTGLAPRFFGAGGARMAEAGVELAFDLTRHSVIGLVEVLKKYRKFKRLFDQLLHLAVELQPDAIIGVDFSGFNRRFAQAVRQLTQTRTGHGSFHNWNPKLIQYVSPQVWASRPGRARQMARIYDLVLSIFPFEKEWYARRVPQLNVEFVGHPLLDRYADGAANGVLGGAEGLGPNAVKPERRLVALLPGSRQAEVKRHLPVMLGALAILRQSHPKLLARVVLPEPELVSWALASGACHVAGRPAPVAEAGRAGLEPGLIGVQAGGLAETLSGAALALASTGTVTMECAYFKVPTVTLYQTSWSTYQIGKRIVHVPHVAMPNIIAGETIFPEFIQGEATAPRIARAALELLEDENRRSWVKAKLAGVVRSLGEPGANCRAARAIGSILKTDSSGQNKPD